MSIERIENNIKEFFEGDMLKNALGFLVFLKANGMVAGGEHGEVTFENKCICYMHIGNGQTKPAPWTIWTEGDYSREYDSCPIDEDIKKIAWDNINYCANCGGVCSPGKQKIVFGKEFNNVCSADMAFYVPDAESLECVEKLLGMRKHLIQGILSHSE
jgi:hypothetical protein